MAWVVAVTVRDSDNDSDVKCEVKDDYDDRDDGNNDKDVYDNEYWSSFVDQRTLIFNFWYGKAALR